MRIKPELKQSLLENDGVEVVSHFDRNGRSDFYEGKKDNRLIIIQVDNDDSVKLLTWLEYKKAVYY